MLKMLDIVELKKDDQETGIKKGTIGTVVDIHNDGEAYTVEFFDDDNETIEESLYKDFKETELKVIK